MVIKCPKCQTDNPSDSKYCRECGAALRSAEVSVTKTIESPTEATTPSTSDSGTSSWDSLMQGQFLPGNVLAGRYRITDFGLARLAAEQKISDGGSGTLAYMAPEQLIGGQVTEKSDI